MDPQTSGIVPLIMLEEKYLGKIINQKQRYYNFCTTAKEESVEGMDVNLLFCRKLHFELKKNKCKIAHCSCAR